MPQIQVYQVLACKTMPSEPLFCLQLSKTPRTPNLSKICPGDCFWGFHPIGWTGICQQKLSRFVREHRFSDFYRFLTNFSPPLRGRGCLGEGRLGVSGQVWEFRFLPLFPSFPREKLSVQEVSGKAPGSPRHPTNLGFGAFLNAVRGKEGSQTMPLNLRCEDSPPQFGGRSV